MTSASRVGDKEVVVNASAAQLLREYMQIGRVLHLATSTPSVQPWLVHVWYAVDSDLNVYFTSNKARRHSEEIRQNAQVAGGVVAIDLEGLGQTVRGVSFEGHANELSAQDARDAYEIYRARWPQVADLIPLDPVVSGDSPMRMYRIVPSRYVLFDELNFPGQPRQDLVTW